MKTCLSLLVLVLLMNTAATAQNSEVNGIVKNRQGNVLSGANVLVKGTTNGATTDGNGHFTLSVARGDSVLVVSYLGYQDKEVGITTGTLMEIVIVPTSVSLNEVVAVGYGTQKKVNLTGSVASVSGEELAKRPVMRASSALEGLASGVTVRQTTGEPGGDGGSIKVRGVGTLGNADPLVLIDGMEGSLDGIDPNDIESISVLKDRRRHLSMDHVRQTV